MFNKKKNNFSYWVKKVHSKKLQRKHNLKFYLYLFIIIIWYFQQPITINLTI